MLLVCWCFFVLVGVVFCVCVNVVFDGGGLVVLKCFGVVVKLFGVGVFGFLN